MGAVRMELPGWKGLEMKARVDAAMEAGDFYAGMAAKAGAAGGAAVAKSWGAEAVEAYKKAARLAIEAMEAK